jgi:hypothetical protein
MEAVGNQPENKEEYLAGEMCQYNHQKHQQWHTFPGRDFQMVLSTSYILYLPGPTCFHRRSMNYGAINRYC